VRKIESGAVGHGIQSGSACSRGSGARGLVGVTRIIDWGQAEPYYGGQKRESENLIQSETSI